MMKENLIVDWKGFNAQYKKIKMVSYYHHNVTPVGVGIDYRFPFASIFFSINQDIYWLDSSDSVEVSFFFFPGKVP